MSIYPGYFNKNLSALLGHDPCGLTRGITDQPIIEESAYYRVLVKSVNFD
jgi:hypothetical protein